MSSINESNSNEKSKKEEPLISLLYSFKKNITSQDPFYPLNNLLTKNNIYGWQSSRFCSYPQEIIIEFHSYVNIKQINILFHEKKIPTLIEFVNCIPKKLNQNSNNNIYYTNKSIGYIRLSSNAETNYKSRELRKIHVNIFTRRIKLIIHKNYSNAFNIFGQVGIIYMNFLGHILSEENENEKEKLNFSELNLEDDIDDLDDTLIIEKMDEESKEKLKELLLELDEKKKMEEYEECKIIKNKIDLLKKISFKIYHLENYKNQFSAKNDFNNSQKIKNEIKLLKQKINNDLYIKNNINNNIGNNINKFNTINTDLLYNNNINNNINNNKEEEKLFTRKLNNNKKINNKLILSQSHPDIFNISENKYDDIVLPTIQKKINTNLSSIHLNNNSSTSFDHYDQHNNSINSSGVFDSFQEKKEKIDIKDIPPPEDISEELKNKFKLLIELLGEDIFKKIFSKYIQHKLIGFQELNNIITNKIIEIKGTTQETNKYIVCLINNIFFIYLDDRRPSLVSESLQLFINVLKGIKGRSNSNKTEYDFKITKRLLNRIRTKLNHISKSVRTKAEELYSYMLISNFCEYNSLITELVESDVDNFYKKIGITDRINLNLGKCLNNIMSKGGMSNIKIDATKELIVTKMNIFMKILKDLEKNKENNKNINEKNFPKEIVGDFIIINVDHPKKEVRFVTKYVLDQYVHIFGKDILYKMKYFIGSKELNKLFQDNPTLLKIFSEIEEEEKKLYEKKVMKYRNYLEKKLIFNQSKYNMNNLSQFNGTNNIIKKTKEGKTLIKSASQPEYKISKKIKLKPINQINQLINNIEGEYINNLTNKTKKTKNKKKSNEIILNDTNNILENTKVN